MSTNAIKTNSNEERCLLCETMRFEACLPPHAYQNSGLPGAFLSVLYFLFLAFDFILSAFLEHQMSFLTFNTASYYLMSPPLLPQGPPMSADSSSHSIGIIVPTLQPLSFHGCSSQDEQVLYTVPSQYGV